MKNVNQILSIFVITLMTLTAQACGKTNKETEAKKVSVVNKLPDHPGDEKTTSIPTNVKTHKFTIKAGAIVEVLYFNTDSKTFEKAVKDYGKEASTNGAELLAKFEVIKKETERPVTHIALVQWTDPSRYGKVAVNLTKTLVDVGFFGAQQDTPVILRDDKMYDFTSAWTIATDPCQMPALMQILGVYFGKIGPALQKYGIAQTAFVGPHPAAPKTKLKTYTPQMMGVFQWNSVEDPSKFQADPMFTEHVDIRNAMMKKMEFIYTKAML